jgi:hypothetical protein
MNKNCTNCGGDGIVATGPDDIGHWDYCDLCNKERIHPDDMEELQNPPTEIELAEAMAILNQIGATKLVKVFRKLAFQRDRLTQSSERS